MVFFAKMSRLLSYGWRYFKYMLLSGYYRGYGIHSPFVYDFHRKVLHQKGKSDTLNSIRKYRRKIRKSRQSIRTHDLGTGGNFTSSDSLAIGKAERTISIPHKYGKLLYRMINHYSLENVLEVGTGIGISSLYLGSARAGKAIHTIEGCPEKVALAEQLFAGFNLNHVYCHNGSFEDLLPGVLERFDPPDMVFLDGNHTREATRKYLETILPCLHNDSILVLDDIHWSKEMEQTWIELQEDKRVTVTIDLFRLGIVFFKKELSRQNFRIRY